MDSFEHAPPETSVRRVISTVACEVTGKTSPVHSDENKTEHNQEGHMISLSSHLSNTPIVHDELTDRTNILLDVNMNQ